ncbi:hypothetical protein AmDm5_1203 [Acetobacter malorum]|nr:hypothetical protein AmDm5_1203 [Acetobacter malorum]
MKALAAAAPAFLIRVEEDKPFLKFGLVIVHLRSNKEQGGLAIHQQGQAFV